MPTRSSGSAKVFYPRYSSAELIDLLRARLPSVGRRLPLRRVILFGSWASGRATAFSDIDLLVVYADPSRADAYQVVRRCLQMPGLQPHVYSEEEAAQLQETLDCMTSGGIVLLG